MLQPAGGSHYRRDAQRCQTLDIAERRVRSAELNRHIGTLYEIRIVTNINARMNGEAVLRRKLLNQLAHFSVADNREFRGASYSNDADSNEA
jgi:hypothetical protein